MKNNKRLIRIFLLVFITAIHSCQNQESAPVPVKKKTSELIKKHFDSPGKKKLVSSKVILEFIDYNDDGDYMLLNAQKGRTLYSFINDKNEDRSLLRGDLVEITWKWDTIYIAGDGETPELAEWLISIRKIKDGNVSVFRKTYNKPIEYYWAEDCDFSTGFKDKLYSLVEYYLANSDNESVKLPIKNKDDLVYSIEKREQNGSEFIALGISNDMKDHTNIIQWLYYSPNTDKLYEYDLPHDKLKEVK
jgi:hypothetical protein